MYPADDRPERLACLFVRMDGLDSSAALAAKNDAARLLTAAQLSFTAIAGQLEERRLLMPPDIIAAIKRIDLPGEGDAAFVGARKLLARAKLGFQDIASILAAAQPERRQAAAATLPPIVNMRAEPTASPRIRSISEPAPRRRVERNTDDYRERPRYRAQPNCWGGVGDCGWGGFRS